MLFEQWKIGPMDNCVYVFGSDEGADVALVDPGFEVSEVLARIDGLGRRVSDIVATHGHYDHVQGIPEARKHTEAPVWAHPRAQFPVDRALDEHTHVTIAGIDVEVLHTPGHSPDAVCLVLDGTHLLTGDTLFIGECGRVDLPGSDPEQMHETLLTRLARLPGHLLVCPGHDYGATPMSTLEHERLHNYTLKPRTREEFLRFMAEP